MAKSRKEKRRDQVVKRAIEALRAQVAAEESDPTNAAEKAGYARRKAAILSQDKPAPKESK